MTEHEMPCKYQDKIFTLCEDTAEIKAVTKSLSIRINGSMDAIHKHIQDGKAWRTLLVSLSLGVVINIVVFAYMFGELHQKVTDNCDHLNKIIEKVHK